MPVDASGNLPSEGKNPAEFGRQKIKDRIQNTEYRIQNTEYRRTQLSEPRNAGPQPGPPSLHRSCLLASDGPLPAIALGLKGVRSVGAVKPALTSPHRGYAGSQKKPGSVNLELRTLALPLHGGSPRLKNLRNFGLDALAHGLDLRGRGESHNYRFGCRSIALIRHAADRNQHVSLGKIGRDATTRNRIGRDEKSIRMALIAFEMARDIDRLALHKSCHPHILRIHENDSSPVVDAAIAIVQTIDRCVELIVTTHRHQNILAGINGKKINLVDGEICLSSRCRKLPPVPWGIWQIEDSFRYPMIEMFEARNHLLDFVPNQIVVGGPSRPFQLRSIS